MAGKVFTTDPSQPLEIRLGEGEEFSARPPQTVGSVFRQTVATHGDKQALAYKSNGGDWTRLSYTQYYNLCVRVAKSFRKVQ